MKRVLVTGGNAGIGLALCRQLCVDHGCHVIMGSRSELAPPRSPRSVHIICSVCSCRIAQAGLAIVRWNSQAWMARAVPKKRLCYSTQLSAQLDTCLHIFRDLGVDAGAVYVVP